MKKIIYALLLLMLPVTLIGCELTTGSGVELEFFGISDTKISVQDSGIYNVLSGIEVLFGDKYITEDLFAQIIDLETLEEVVEIERNVRGKYKVIYSIYHPETNKLIQRERIIQVGDECQTCIPYDRSKVVYQEVWSDEFNYEGKADPAKWKYETGGSGWGNQELQYYTNREENAFVKDGKLTINLKKEAYGGKQYTSARLITNGLFDFTYGKVEASAKLPKGKGTWPAIWMLASDYRTNIWPRCGEIDIMEHVGYEQGRVHSTIHTYLYNGGKGSQKGKSLFVNDVSEAFHTYGVEWLPDRLIFTVDDKLIFEYNALHQNNGNPTKEHWPFDSNFFLILNIAFGGDWGGAHGIDPNFVNSTMEIDYVRVYQSEYITELTGRR